MGGFRGAPGRSPPYSGANPSRLSRRAARPSLKDPADLAFDMAVTTRNPKKGGGPKRCFQTLGHLGLKGPPDRSSRPPRPVKMAS